MRKDQRRKFLLASGALLAARLASAQQPARRFRVGVLQIAVEARVKSFDQAFLAGLRDRGYLLGQNLVVDFRYSDGDPDRLQALADELIALKPDVLVGSEITSSYMKAKTSTLPIVLLTSADPVAAGLVLSLARPGTNVTGMAGLMYPLVAKQVELLTELVPKMSRLALLAPPFDPPKDHPYFGRPEPWESATRAAAKVKGLALLAVKVRDSESLREAFTTLEKERPDGLLIPTNAVVTRLTREIIDGARRLRLPTISGYAQFVEAGGLLSYGPNFVENYRYAAKFVDLILKGAKPGDLPVEQVSKFEFLVNQRTARELGLKIPQSILVRADRAIE